MKRLIPAFCSMLAAGVAAAATPYRLYDDLAFFVDNPEGKAFTVTLEVRDINHIGKGPGELLVKIYDPDGGLPVREVIPDDGVEAKTGSGMAVTGWDHEAWYYETCYSRGLEPAVRWSSFSDPARLAGMPVRTFTYTVNGGPKGVYRILTAGSPDLYVSVALAPDLPVGVSGGPEWVHGHHDLYARRYLYVPKGAEGLGLGLLEMDAPKGRRCVVKTLDGRPVVLKYVARARTGEITKEMPMTMAVDSSGGYSTASGEFDPPGRFDGQVLMVEVSGGPGDYLLSIDLLFPKEQRNWRGRPSVPAVLCADEAAARALKNGAIEHDGRLFWQMHQVKLYDWLKTLKPEELAMPADLPVKPGFISVGSHQSPMKFVKQADLQDPRPGSADLIMHSYELHHNRAALNAALREMLEGMLIIGPNDRVMHGENLAYEMGTYSYFYHRPAWRILQLSDAPEAAKGPVRDFIIQVGDRLAFCRGLELVNGNSLASLVQGLRYCAEASGDPLQKQLFDTYWERFTTGGFGSRFGVGPSGGVQESFGYDHHYGAYVLSGWQAVLADLHDPRFQKVYNGVLNLYSYVASQGLNAAPWCSRTSHAPTRYSAWMEGPYRWKGVGGPDFTETVNGANEFFVARRPTYYAVTYHGRLTPTWLGEGFHGQIGYGGGALCQVHVIGKGQVIASTLNGDYGSGMHASQWRRFHLHSIVGQTADGQPLVTANSEQPNARLVGTTVTGSAEVRQSSVAAARSYTFGADDIVCSVSLKESGAERVFGINGGAHGLRGQVTEAYEMIPFVKVTAPAGRGKPPVVKTVVTALDADGKPAGVLTAAPRTAAAVQVDQGGYGMRLELDRPRPVLLGERDTILIMLAGRAAAAPAIAEGEAPKEGGEAAEPAEGEAEASAGESAPAAQPAGAVSANSIALSYRVKPYIGEPPTGPVQPVDAAAAASAAPVPAAAPRPPTPPRPLAMLPALGSPEAVAAALAAQEPVKLMLNGAALAEVRVGVAGPALAVSATVIDSKPTQQAVAWKGSCLEVFGAMPEGPAIGQVFLVPAVGDAPAKAFLARSGQQAAAPEIGIRSAPEKGGYTLQALIPMEILRVDPAKGPILLEFQVGATGAPDAKGASKTVHATAFGSKTAYMDSRDFAPFAPAPARP